MSGDIRWEEPPPPDERSTPLGSFAAALRARPDEWAICTTKKTSQAARSYAHHIKVAAMVAFRPAGHFDAVARTVDGEHRVYVRYVGEAGRD